MKASELMLGNWVIATEAMPLPHEVAKMLPKAGKVVEIDGDVVYLDFVDFGFMLDCIEPVPLTADILEKNGFECRGAWCLPGEDMGLRQDGDTWAVLSHYGMYTSIPFCRISYVHQLQQALRLCGIEKEITI